MRKKVIAGLMAMVCTFTAFSGFTEVGLSSILDNSIQAEAYCRRDIADPGDPSSLIERAEKSTVVDDYRDNNYYSTSVSITPCEDFEGLGRRVTYGKYDLGIAEISTTYMDWVTNEETGEKELATLEALHEYRVAILDRFSGLTYTSIELGGEISGIPSVIYRGEGDDREEIYISDNTKATVIEGISTLAYTKEVTIKDTIKYICDGAFSGLKYITVVDIPSSVVSMGDGIFSESGVKTVNFKNVFTKIPENTFSNTQLSKVTFADETAINVIGSNAFSNTVITQFPISNTVDPLEINSGAFSECAQLASIVTPDSTFRIREGAFADCTAAKTLKVGKNCELILARAFSNCSALTDIELNDSLQYIGSEAFSYCTSLVNAPKFPSTVNFRYTDDILGISEAYVEYDPYSVDTLSAGVLSATTSTSCYGLFSGCTALKNVTIPDNAGFIPESFCEGCTSLTSVSMPKYIDFIGNNAFRDCSNLQEIMLSDGVGIIGAHAFDGCSSLRELPFKECDEIYECAFNGCSSLQSIDITCSIVLDSAFRGCTSATKIDCHAERGIGADVFSGCSSAIDANIYRQSISDRKNSHYLGAFLWSGGILSDCTSLESAYIDLKGWNSIPSGLFLNDSKLKTLKTTDLTNVEIVLSDAFANCSSLEVLSLPKVTIVENGAFYNCESLKKICSGDITIKDYGERSFYNCRSLVQEVNANVSTLGNSAFSGSGISEVTISGTDGNTLVIGDSVFSDCEKLIKADIQIPIGIEYSIGNSIFSGCTELTKAIYNGTEIPNSMFSGCAKLETVQLDRAVDVRDCAFLGCTNLYSISGIKTFKTIGSAVFSSCERLTGTYADANTTYTGDSQYKGCTGIVKANVYSITPNMFEGCTGMTEAVLANNISVIEEGAFSDCINLSKVNLDKIVEYKYGAMQNTGISNLNIKNVNNIGERAFADCNKLNKASIVALSIGESAFDNCIKLNTLDLTANSIGSYAFNHCGSLYSVHLNNISGYSLTSIGDNAIKSDVLNNILIPSSVKNMGSWAIGYNTDGGVTEGFVIYGTKNTAAQKYAASNEIEFRDASTYDETALIKSMKLKGDVDANGVISVIDIIKMQKWLLKQQVSGIYAPNMDMNGDNKCNVFDLCLLKRELLKQNATDTENE